MRGKKYLMNYKERQKYLEEFIIIKLTKKMNKEVLREISQKEK